MARRAKTGRGNELLLVGVGALVLGGIAYAIYKSSSNASANALSSQAQAQLASNQGSVVGVNNQANQMLQQGTATGNQQVVDMGELG